MATIAGIHHVTAVCDTAGQNIAFYADLLGLRLVKRTVNFDAPDSYHLYYGDELGRPGTLMTFFAWPDTPHGRLGTGQVESIALGVPPDSLEYWADRLANRKIDAETVERFDERLLRFHGPDALRLELAETEIDAEPWEGGSADPEHAIGGLYGVTLALEGYERTADLLGAMGYDAVGEEDDRFRYVASDEPGSILDVRCRPGLRRGRIGVGSVHHVAFRAADSAIQREWRETLVGRGLDVTPVLDRTYFESIYFREPGGVLFEIATDGPGFTIDEPETSLGEELRLPDWLEPRRAEIERDLPMIFYR
ncbi:ring-cleaving dioxygenase [Halalkalicoccus jeotgali]|uniref:Glyoxalase/bleomycin resistance protein/dioxygenase n=1 Tax=Halalkalicoccus jeotgali (strain DSM 18796 / CECT 7217 / JCM 14584 / KCTC 4019 / B3) TaxID=795797 RepID=D8J628_HALJB|nr:ring-cleaving dioxygenase [Halalkalicoccus jeotgali]ADJ15746.1 Glyoxalase/bleomycin resistance protein/dioxygenase [Halalkalicoccus jeotgali B3]ELY37230.1 Glyoxalase/bleomycin resistance protein/dioxygenase [Halalkalicoccus jeotgali B3]